MAISGAALFSNVKGGRLAGLSNGSLQVRKDVADPTGVFRLLSPTVVADLPTLDGQDEAMR
jgi:hypothetical protein